MARSSENKLKLRPSSNLKKSTIREDRVLRRLLRKDEMIYDDRTAGDLIEKKKKFHLIDLFAGAGGMSLGFSEAFGHVFKSVLANDFDKACVETYNANFGNHSLWGDIDDLLSDRAVKIPKCDVVIGGPPCQGFSLLNKNRGGDPRKQLWRPYMKVVERSGASVFVMENVPQLLGTFEHGEIIGSAESLGFKLHATVLNAADYGVSQTRKRAVIVGCKHMDPKSVFPPRKTNFNPRTVKTTPVYIEGIPGEYLPKAEKWRTVRDAISDLPVPEGIEIREIDPPMNLHFGRTPTKESMARYRAIPKEGMNRFDLQKNAPYLTPKCWIKKKSGGTDLFGRLWWDRPAFTIRTEFFKPEKGRYLHPIQHRPITHREAARLQSFPDSFVFKGSKIEVARQIGNAVPPLLAARIADVVYLLLSTTSGK
jgi:DNA (cytosine-5)-methyltransferase 1